MYLQNKTQGKVNIEFSHRSKPIFSREQGKPPPPPPKIAILVGAFAGMIYKKCQGFHSRASLHSLVANITFA